jgi:hypothetical protein
MPIRTAGADVTQAARNVLARINGLVADNEETMLREVETVTATLAQNASPEPATIAAKLPKRPRQSAG